MLIQMKLRDDGSAGHLDYETHKPRPRVKVPIYRRLVAAILTVVGAGIGVLALMQSNPSARVNILVAASAFIICALIILYGQARIF